MAGVATATKSTKATHPPTSQMVLEAIETLNEGRHGSSVQAIKKYLSSNFASFDLVKSGHLIKKYLKSAVEKGELVQTSGKGCTGSFKLAPVPKKKKEEAVKTKPKEKEAKPAAKTSAKQPTKGEKEVKTAKKPSKKTASMEKKSVKSPTSKPKAPKKSAK